jgi:5'(3')-deoxyribonucleotidase
MSKNTIYNINSLKKDLLSLYLESQNTCYEDLFYKVANVHNVKIKKWIGNREKAILKKITNPNVFYALKLLNNFSQSQGDSAPIQSIISFFADDKHSKYIPVILQFFNLLNDPSVSFILSPFQNIISKFNIFSSDEDILNTEEVKSDLLIIATDIAKNTKDLDTPTDEIKHRKSTKKIAILEVFRDLLQLFSREIGNAFINNGYEELGKEVLNKGILANPTIIIPKIDGEINITNTSTDKALEYAKSIMKNIDPADSYKYYNYLRNEIMAFAGIISSEELFQYTVDKKRKLDFSDFMGTKNDDDIDIEDITDAEELISVEDQYLLNPLYITVISLILYSLYAHGSN